MGRFKITVQGFDESGDAVYTRDRITEVRTIVSIIMGGSAAEYITVDQGKWTIARFCRTKARWDRPASTIRAN